MEKSQYPSSWIKPEINENSYRTGLKVNNSLVFNGELVSFFFSIHLIYKGRVYSIQWKDS